MNRDREALLNSIRTCLEAFDATGHCGESTSERISRERRQDCALHAMPGILRLARRELLALPPAGGVEEALRAFMNSPHIDEEGRPRAWRMNKLRKAFDLGLAALSPTTLGGRSGSAQDGLPPARSLPSEPASENPEHVRVLVGWLLDIVLRRDISAAELDVQMAVHAAKAFLGVTASTGSATGASRAEGEQASKNTTPQGEES